MKGPWSYWQLRRRVRELETENRRLKNIRIEGWVTTRNDAEQAETMMLGGTLDMFGILSAPGLAGDLLQVWIPGPHAPHVAGLGTVYLENGGLVSLRLRPGRYT